MLMIVKSTRAKERMMKSTEMKMVTEMQTKKTAKRVSYLLG